MNEPLEGTDRAIRALKDAGKRVVFVSNNGAKSLDSYQKQIAGLGHSASEDDIVYPAISVVRYLQSIDFKGLIFAICSKTFMDILRKAGYEVISGVSFSILRRFYFFQILFDSSPTILSRNPLTSS